MLDDEEEQVSLLVLNDSGCGLRGTDSASVKGSILCILVGGMHARISAPSVYGSGRPIVGIFLAAHIAFGGAPRAGMPFAAFFCFSAARPRGARCASGCGLGRRGAAVRAAAWRAAGELGLVDGDVSAVGRGGPGTLTNRLSPTKKRGVAEIDAGAASTARRGAGELTDGAPAAATLAARGRAAGGVFGGRDRTLTDSTDAG